MRSTVKRNSEKKLTTQELLKTLRVYDQVPDAVDISYIAEDFGSQESLLISPKTIREVFIPRMKRMIDLAHQAGAYVFFHSDGAIRQIIPDMIEAGIDVLNPMQWRCRGMDREGLKQDFGDQVIFHGAVDNQQTFAFGGVEDVREEVAYNIQVLGGGEDISWPPATTFRRSALLGTWWRCMRQDTSTEGVEGKRLSCVRQHKCYEDHEY